MKRLPANPADDRPVPMPTRVSHYAQKLWAEAGRPEGREADIWLEAERHVMDEEARGDRSDSGARPPQVRAAGRGNVTPTNPPGAGPRRP